MLELNEPWQILSSKLLALNKLKLKPGEVKGPHLDGKLGLSPHLIILSFAFIRMLVPEAELNTYFTLIVYFSGWIIPVLSHVLALLTPSSGCSTWHHLAPLGDLITLLVKWAW